MAYDATALKMIAGAAHTASRVWFYRSQDAMATVRAADYFANAQWLGMKVGDVVHVQTVNGSGVPTAHTISVVLAVDGDGADLADGTAITLTNT